MSERVVYFLGAGFAAPLGLPTVSNFLERAKDQHLLAHRGGDHFVQVFDEIARISVVKNTYAADLSNIEEILSILEVDAFLGAPNLRALFQAFLKDVVAYYTPAFSPHPGGFSVPNWPYVLFGEVPIHNHLGVFACALQNLRLGAAPSKPAVVVDRVANTNFTYDVVTTNYDLLLENACEYLRQYTLLNSSVGFRRKQDDDPSHPILAKLHGTIDEGDIVPPTWSKGAHPEIANGWSLARNVLERAHHIRFLGYSLPVADSYVRYLLKSAALNSKHLKTIDVVCMDKGGAVRSRYEDFVALPSMRFANINVASYLDYFAGRRLQTLTSDRPLYESLEEAHGYMMSKGA